MHKSKKSLKAFSLIELSIVIVVISLIVAGVTAGNSLVQSARLRTQASQLIEMTIAFSAFVGMYNAIPGDMVNASSYWSGVTNGDGNGRYNHTSTCGLMTFTNQELWTVFQHLSAAKLISGSYNNTYVLNTGYPSLKINPKKGMNAGYGIDIPNGYNNYQLSDNELNIIHKAALYLIIADPSADAGGTSYNGTMTPIQAKAIDTKIDDGIARKGNFRAFSGWNSWVTASTSCLTGVDGDYDISRTNGQCMGEYILKH